jgi:hypothetical protein
MITAAPAEALADPLALHESAGGARDRTVVVTKGSLILALVASAVFAYLQQDRGMWHFGLAAACVVVPPPLQK